MKFLIIKIVLCIEILLINIDGFAVDSYANRFPYDNDNSGHSFQGKAVEDRSHGAAGGEHRIFSNNKHLDKATDVKAAQDFGKYSQFENNSNNHEFDEIKNSNNIDLNKHSIGEDFENDKSHNRKHIKSGFRNTYHKDESGSNSSFYEDSDDRGGRVTYDKKFGTKNNENDAKYHEGKRSGANSEKHDGRQGGYESNDSNRKYHLVNKEQDNRHGQYENRNHGQGEQYTYVKDDRDRYRPYNQYHGNYYNQYGSYPDRNTDYDKYQGNSYGYNNGYAHRLPNHLPPQTAFETLPLDKDEGYFSRHRITIYEDPREYLDPRYGLDHRREDYQTNFHDYRRYHSPALEFRPSSNLNFGSSTRHNVFDYADKQHDFHHRRPYY